MAPSRDRACEEIAAGRVTVSGVPADKPARHGLARRPGRSWSDRRRGSSAEAARSSTPPSERFDVTVAGRRALDAGASTGGFTDCLLQRGASASSPSTWATVSSISGFARIPGSGCSSGPTSETSPSTTSAASRLPLIVADLSFISLRTVAPALLGLAAAGADLVLLVKPQFEAGRVEASRGRGVIRRPDVWQRVLEQVVATYAQGGADLRGLMASPLLGAEGNAEFLAHFVATRPETRTHPQSRTRTVLDAASPSRAVAEATARSVRTG